ncbi:hypothetical protein GYMLUDRAFT_66620 [Collybiopsis luxurians FD-317 M1]|nr:hypothetical protein GYMLUDRAFT_66620 [Collybiopsis luxurians FD-317 M1]
MCSLTAQLRLKRSRLSIGSGFLSTIGSTAAEVHPLLVLDACASGQGVPKLWKSFSNPGRDGCLATEQSVGDDWSVNLKDPALNLASKITAFR